MLMEFRYTDEPTDDALADARQQWNAKCEERGRSTETDVRVEVVRDGDGFTVVMNDGTADIQ